MKYARFLSLVVLVGILAAQLYSDPPSWWWLAKPVIMAAWYGLTALPPQAQFALLAIAWMVLLLWGLLRKWGFHILLAIPVLAYFVGFGQAVHILLYVLPGLIVGQLGYRIYCWCRNRWWPSTVVQFPRRAA